MQKLRGDHKRGGDKFEKKRKQSRVEELTVAVSWRELRCSVRSSRMTILCVRDTNAASIISAIVIVCSLKQRGSFRVEMDLSPHLDKVAVGSTLIQVSTI